MTLKNVLFSFLIAALCECSPPITVVGGGESEQPSTENPHDKCEEVNGFFHKENDSFYTYCTDLQKLIFIPCVEISISSISDKQCDATCVTSYKSPTGEKIIADLKNVVARSENVYEARYQGYTLNCSGKQYYKNP